MALGVLDRSAGIATAAGAAPVVIHPGYFLGRTREESIADVVEQLGELGERLEGKGRLVPFGVEVMGRGRARLGRGRSRDRRRRAVVRPVLDFAHMHATSDGAFLAADAFVTALELADGVLGPDEPFHIHFSDIQYANRNETKHLPYGRGRCGPSRCGRRSTGSSVRRRSSRRRPTRRRRRRSEPSSCVSAEEVERHYEAAARRPRQPGEDQLHVRGAEATVELAELAALREGERVLDVGAGLGGPARFLAERFGVDVTGVDVTAAFVERAKALARDAGLADRVRFVRADATSLPFARRRLRRRLDAARGDEHR